MRKGQKCMVRWQDAKSKTFRWYEAVIKTVDDQCATVIWMDGKYKGHETDRIPLSWILIIGTRVVLEEMHTMKVEIMYLLNNVLSKMNDLNDSSNDAEISDLLGGLSSMSFSSENREFADPNKTDKSYVDALFEE